MFVQIVTDTTTLPEAALFARLDRVASLPPAARQRLSVQLRDPGLPTRSLLRLARQLREATARLGAALLVNDRIDIALLVGADGVHLGRASVSIADARALLGPRIFIQVSCHSPAEVVEAAASGADAALLAPIFASPGKPHPLGTAALRQARNALLEKALSLRLLALGGVTLENAASCFDASSDGVAAIRADLTPLLGT